MTKRIPLQIRIQTARWSRLKIGLTIIAALILLAWLVSLALRFPVLRVGTIALIKLDAPVVVSGDNLLGRTLKSEDVVKLVKEVGRARGIVGLLIEINSPGGSAVATAEIAEAISRINKSKVALIREIGASGAYWIASAADVVVAHPMSITGSIGVRGSYLEFAGLLREWNISYQQLVAGRLKEAGVPWKELTDEERALLQSALDKVYEEFVAAIAANRNLSLEQVRQLADGRFFLGSEAKELGLVDELGGRERAMEILKQLTNQTELELIEYAVRRPLLERLREIRTGGLESSFARTPVIWV